MQHKIFAIGLGALCLFGIGCGNPFVPAEEKKGDGKIVVTYKYPISPEDSICSVEPTTLSGKTQKGIAQPYVHMRFLGQVFTEYQCKEGSEGYDPEQLYEDGSRIKLKNVATAELYTVLKDVGYLCASGPESGCMEWMLEQPVPMRNLMRIEPFVDEIQSDDCVNCRR